MGRDHRHRANELGGAHEGGGGTTREFGNGRGVPPSEVSRAVMAWNRASTPDRHPRRLARPVQDHARKLRVPARCLV
jgi:hypothetical protein